MKLFPDPLDKFHELGNLLGIHAGGRFIEQQQLSASWPGPGDLQSSLQAVGKVFGQFLGVPFQLQEGQQVQGMVDNRFLFPAETAQVEQRLQGTVPDLAVMGDADIIQDRQFLEKADILEGAGNAQGGDLAGRFADESPCRQRQMLPPVAR